MENNVKQMAEYINYLITKNLELIKNDLTLKEAADIERLTELMTSVNGDKEKAGSISFNKILSEYDSSIENAVTQSEMIVCFREFISKISVCSGFFVLKNDKAICFDVYPESSALKKGYSFDFVLMENNYQTLSESKLPENIKQVFSNVKNVFVYPIFVKYRHSGYIIASLNDINAVEVVKVAAATLSREFTLLPLKNKLKPQIQSQKPKTETKPVEKVPPVNKVEQNQPEHKTIEVQDDGEVIITKSVSGSFSGDEDEMTRAKRYAKLLVDELELYNKKAVDKGRAKGGLKTLLKSDIERSYESFRHRFSNSDRVPDEIFNQALVLYLAKGNPDLL